MDDPLTRRDSPDPPPAPTRWWIGAVYLLLFALSVPWYLPASDRVPIWLGLPHWVVLSIAWSVAVALFTAFVAARYWPPDMPGPPGGANQ